MKNPQGVPLPERILFCLIKVFYSDVKMIFCFSAPLWWRNASAGLQVVDARD
jgi:hypothetical protein